MNISNSLTTYWNISSSIQPGWVRVPNEPPSPYTGSLFMPRGTTTIGLIEAPASVNSGASASESTVSLDNNWHWEYTQSPKPLYWYSVSGADENGLIYTQLVCANGLDDLCTKLQSSFVAQPLLNWQISSIQQYSIPVYSDTSIPQNGTWETVNWQNVPECLIFTVSFVGNVDMQITSNVEDIEMNTYLIPTILAVKSVFSDPGSLGTFNVSLECNAAVVDITPSFYEDIDYYNTPINWSNASGVIDTDCQCNNMPIELYLQHEFNKFGKLAPFITRNYFDFPSTFNLSWNNQFWQHIFHFQGLGLDLNTTESWTLRFEWACTDTLNLAPVGGNAWQFAAIITRTIVETAVTTQSKIIFAFVPNLCSNGELSVSFTYYGALNDVVTVDGLKCVLVSVVDDIGLQSGGIWNSNPTLTIVITGRNPITTSPTFALNTLINN